MIIRQDHMLVFAMFNKRNVISLEENIMYV